MKNKIILILLTLPMIFISNKVFAEYDETLPAYLLNRYFNIDALSLSNSYRTLYQKESKEEFLRKYTNYEGFNIVEKQKLINTPTKDLCFNVYYGKDKIFRKSEREGKVCLQLLVLNGFGDSAKILSEIFFYEGAYNEATLFYAVSQTLGANSDIDYEFKLKDNTKNFDDMYYKSLKVSAAIPFLFSGLKDYNTYDISILNQQIEDPKYYNTKNDPNSYPQRIYTSLKNQDFKSFIDIRKNIETSGQKLFLLAGSKAGDYDKLSEYCFNLDNQYLGEYCLAAIFNYNQNNKALSRYFYLKYSNYKENDNVKLKEISQLLGLNSEDFITNKIFKNMISKYSINLDILEKIIYHYNYGRIVKKNLEKNNT
tara:strand:- start:17268 stop:18371 length:1104 start_codon:yes stop_codon:yes gene_type:complete